MSEKMQEQMPLFPEKYLAVPNVFLRSALFGAGSLGERVENMPIACYGSDEIFFSGTLPDCVDLEYLGALWHFAAVGDAWDFVVPMAEIFSYLKISDSGSARQVFDSRMKTLRSSAISVRSGDAFYVGGLLDSYERDAKGLARVRLNPEIVAFLQGDKYTLIQWRIRKELRGRHLAQWVHAFYSSHSEPYAMNISTLARLSRSSDKRPSSFKKRLLAAFDLVAAAHAKFGLHFSGSIVGDKAAVRRDKLKRWDAAEVPIK